MRYKSLLLVLLFLVSRSALSFSTLPTVISYPGASGAVAAGGAGSYSAASVTGVGMVLLGALTVGMAIGYYGVESLAGDAFRIQPFDKPAAVPPEPAAAATANQFTVTKYKAGGQYYSSYEAACNGAIAYQEQVSPTPGYTRVLHTANPCSFMHVNDASGSASGPYPLGVGQENFLECPRGYIVSGSSCALVNAREATDDHSCDVLLNAGQFAVAADRNCPATASGSQLSPLIRGGSTYGYGTNSSGQPLMFEVSRQNNVVYLREYVQTTVNGQSQVQTYQATVNADTGVVTAVSGSVAPGSIAAPSGGSVPTTAPAPDPATTPTVTQNTNQQPLQNIQFPTDYARTGEAQNAANTVRDKLQEFKETTDLTEVQPRPDTDFQASFFAGVFDSLKAWQVPGHSSQCPTGSVSLWGGAYVMDSQCALMNQYFVEFQTVATVVWLLSALFIVLRA